MYNSALNPARFLILTGSLLLAGCSQDPTTGTTQVEGQVIESQSRKPVGNATVQVYHASSGGGYTPVGSGYPTDAQGHFAFAFEAATKFGYLLLATAPPGYRTDWVAAPDVRAGRKNQGLTIPVLAPAWVKLHLVDEPPKSRVVMYISGYDGSGERLYYPHDTVLIRPSHGGFSGKFFWIVTDDKGVDTQYSQDVKLAALDTATVRIPF